MYLVRRKKRKYTFFGWSLLPTDINKTDQQQNVQQGEGEHRDGGIMWESLEVVSASSADSIVSPSSGYLKDGHVLGILGPSGAGKSTFLSAIANRPKPSLQVGGSVLYYYQSDDNKSQSGKYCAPVLAESVAWLRQQDAFFERLNVKETLDLAVFLEWPQLSTRERDIISKRCLNSLGLSKVGNRQVGNPKNIRSARGATLSGGEQRRLSLALELVTKPNLFIADEPTSGLDSKTAESVMASIVSLAREQNIPCFCSLHQAKSSIWHMLDSFILIAPGGRVCYVGSRQDAIPYFALLGYNCPSETNPAEYFVDLVSVDTEDPVKAKIDERRIQKLAISFQQYDQENSRILQTTRLDAPVLPTKTRATETTQTLPTRVALAIQRIGALFRRSWRQAIRSHKLNIFRLSMSVGTALLLPQLFPSVVKGVPTTRSVTDRICLLSFGVINIFMISLMKTLGMFSREKPVVQREKIRKDYTTFEYLLSKSVAELPLDITFAMTFASTLKLMTGLASGWKHLSLAFALVTTTGASLGFLLGSATPNEDAALATAMPVLIVLMIVGIINPSGVDPATSTSWPVQLAKVLSPIAAAIEALCVAEFSGMKFATTKSIIGIQKLKDLPRMGGLALIRDGGDALSALGLAGVRFEGLIWHLVGLSVLNFGLCWSCLHFSEFGTGRWIQKMQSFVVMVKRTFQSRRSTR